MRRQLRQVLFLLSGALLLVLALPAAAFAQSEAPGCVAKGCHAAVIAQTHLHSALGDGDCTDCHEGTDDPSARCKSGQSFTVEEDPALCVNCHDDPRIDGLTHPALEDGCLACHGAHGGEDAFNLIEKTTREVCEQCHDTFEGASTHAPVVAGKCTGCHDPHASVNKPLLKKPRKALCFECHSIESLRPKTKSGYLARHAPVEGGACLQCHRPHVSERKPLLRNTTNVICLGCHGPNTATAKRSLKKVKTDAQNLHPPLEDGECTDCHGPHGAEQPKLLKQKRPELCYECHDEFEGPFLHSAVKLGRCNGCHDPHGEDRATLLKGSGSGLCFGCHADDLTGRKVQHAPAEAGACMACHDPHQGSNPKLLKRGEGPATCLSCHDESGEAALKFAYEGKIHPAIERFGCTVCHDPHGGDSPRLLPGTINATCLRCHAEQADGSHIFTSFAGKPHPVEGPKDPGRPGQPFSCISCHLPHGSKFPKLWRQGERRDQMCKGCHQGGQVVYRGLDARPSDSKTARTRASKTPKVAKGQAARAARESEKKKQVPGEGEPPVSRR